jgi:hypothetical protein
MISAEGPIYRFKLFNLPPDEYRIAAEGCPVTEHVCARSAWLLHPYLGLGRTEVDLIAETLEKVTGNIELLRRSSVAGAASA